MQNAGCKLPSARISLWSARSHAAPLMSKLPPPALTMESRVSRNSSNVSITSSDKSLRCRRPIYNNANDETSALEKNQSLLKLDRSRFVEMRRPFACSTPERETNDVLLAVYANQGPPTRAIAQCCQLGTKQAGKLTAAVKETQFAFVATLAVPSSRGWLHRPS